MARLNGATAMNMTSYASEGLGVGSMEVEHILNARFHLLVVCMYL